MAEPSFWPYGLGIAVVITLAVIIPLLRRRRKSGSN
uniref:Uncharacterized protein n=3 Tax=environmental samples TaxID=651140 RepID=A0A075H5C5_9ARCH|nr:hypothetical protein [uncultured marine thaumarchaeote KM3_40_A11]AIF12226.1 hypothetical protein [uncultured marine thaumarchaeote KM3_54_H01]AIF12308.1 hypothetical protein [uncultured marine thaumarchaeote KM3_55_A12]